MNLLQMFLGEFWPYLGIGIALALSALGISMKGKSAGRQEVQAQINKQSAEAAKEARDVQAKVNRMDSGTAAAELNRKWMRDKGAGGG